MDYPPNPDLSIVTDSYPPPVPPKKEQKTWGIMIWVKHGESATPLEEIRTANLDALGRFALQLLLLCFLAATHKMGNGGKTMS